jgi:hypothetical protein
MIDEPTSPSESGGPTAPETSAAKSESAPISPPTTLDVGPDEVAPAEPKVRPQESRSQGQPTLLDTDAPTTLQGGGESFGQTAQRVWGQVWPKVKPVLLVGSIKTIKGTVGLLSDIQQQLETTATSSQTALPESISKVTTKTQPILSRLWSAWQGLLQQLRTRAPEKLKNIIQHWPDRLLTAAIVGVLLVGYWLVSAILPDPAPAAPPPKARPVATRPAQPVAEVAPAPVAKPAPTKPAPRPQVVAQAPKPKAVEKPVESAPVKSKLVAPAVVAAS